VDAAGRVNASPVTGFATNFASVPGLMMAMRPGRRVVGSVVEVEVVLLVEDDDVLLVDEELLVVPITEKRWPWMLKLLVSVPAPPLLCHTTTKFPELSAATAGSS
jgi:hypothetical protein